MFLPKPSRVVLGTLAGILAGVIIVGLVVLVIRTWTLADEIREAQKVNTGTLNYSKQSLDRINDCTTPGRKCYDQGQARTGEVVGSLNEVTIASSSYAAACAARGLSSADEIHRCVMAEFKQRERP